MDLQDYLNNNPPEDARIITNLMLDLGKEFVCLEQITIKNDQHGLRASRMVFRYSEHMSATYAVRVSVDFRPKEIILEDVETGQMITMEDIMDDELVASVIRAMYRHLIYDAAAEEAASHDAV